MTNEFTTYEYTDEMHEEDSRLATFVVCRKFPYLLRQREDLIQLCTIRLWRTRPMYDKERSKYSTFAIIVCVRTVLNWVKSKEFRSNWDMPSLDYEIGEGGTTMLEMQTSTDEKQDLDIGYLLQQIYAILKSKNKTNNQPKYPPNAPLRKITTMLIDGKTQYQIAEQLGYTRQNVYKHVQTLRDKLEPRLKASGYLD